LGNTVFGVSVRPSKSTTKIAGAGVKRFLLGIWKYAEVEGEGARFISYTVFEVAGTLGIGAGVCRPLIQIFSLHPIPCGFEQLKKKISKTKYHTQ
jgi:hypothetical protein